MISIRKSIFILLLCFSVCSFFGFIFLLWDGDYIKPGNLSEETPHAEAPDILCIGNSITEHPINDYWFGEWGMAASSKDQSYPYQLELIAETSLQKRIEVECINFAAWDIQSYDRYETFSLIAPFLVPGIDLICLQLGENVTESSTYYKDYLELLSFIREKCPDSKLVLIGDFWDMGLDEFEMQAAASMNIDYISLTDLRESEEDFTVSLGDVVYDADGNEHVVSHEGVARHPNDKAHRIIAERIFDAYSHSN